MPPRKKGNPVSSTDPSDPAAPDPAVDPSLPPPADGAAPDLPVASDEPPFGPDDAPLAPPVDVSTDDEGNVVEVDAPASVTDEKVADQGPVTDTNPVDAAGAPADHVAQGSIVTTPADALSPRPIEIAGVGAGTPPDAAAVPDVSQTATSPTTGEQIRTGDNSVIVPLNAQGDNQAAIDDPAVPVVAAHEDPHGAAQAVLDQERVQPDEVVASRAEVMAQRVLDEGTLTPAVPGNATAPVETLDHHTVDPSGTADDSQPGAFAEPAPSDTDTAVDTNNHPGEGTDAATATFDTRLDEADRAGKGQTTLAPEVGEEIVVSTAKSLAQAGFHADLLHQWVDQAFSDLQGQRNSAQQAGGPDPYPRLSI